MTANVKKGDRVMIRSKRSFPLTGVVTTIQYRASMSSDVCYPARVFVLHSDGKERDWDIQMIEVLSENH